MRSSCGLSTNVSKVPQVLNTINNTTGFVRVGSLAWDVGCGGVQVMEETGYDASAGANEKDFLTLYLNGQQTTMYIVTAVDEGFAFEPQVRWAWCC